MRIFQISEEDLKCFSSLEEEDIGKWYIIFNGCLIGFFDCREKAEQVACHFNHC
jgi:hypothetical protein